MLGFVLNDVFIEMNGLCGNCVVLGIVFNDVFIEMNGLCGMCVVYMRSLGSVWSKAYLPYMVNMTCHLNESVNVKITARD